MAPARSDRLGVESVIGLDRNTHSRWASIPRSCQSAFSGASPRSRSPNGIQPASPPQRTWMMRDSSGRSRRNAATVLGASSFSRRAANSEGMRPKGRKRNHPEQAEDGARGCRPPAPVTVVVPGFSPAACGPASFPPEMTPAGTDEVAQQAGSGHSPRRAVRPRPKGSRSVSLGREPRPSPEAPRGRPASPRTPARGATRRPGPCWRTCPRRSPPR